MQTANDHSTPSDAVLQILLFVDRRASSIQQVQQVQDYLNVTKGNCKLDLQIIDIVEHPYLVEYFKLVASPALIKIYPEPRQIIAGTNLIAQLKAFWPQWQQTLQKLESAEQRPSEDTPALSQPSGNPQLRVSGLLQAQKQQLSDPHILSHQDADSLTSSPSAKPASNSFTYVPELLRFSDEIFRLKQETEELREQLQFKDRVIAMLAHDLRNPLTAASIALETLELGLQPPTEEDPGLRRITPEVIQQLLRHARTQTRAIDRMITDILQGARDKGSNFKIQAQDLELGELCETVLELVDKSLKAKHQKIETDIPNDLPHVYADSERIQQVLMNLLDNAIKYTPVGGTIQISMLHRTTQKVQVSICDNGPGVPEENQQNIFEDHFRLQRDQAQTGYGIGLSLCQRIIRAHYGQIWVDSVPGQGSCFHFTLPVYCF